MMLGFTGGLWRSCSLLGGSAVGSRCTGEDFAPVRQSDTAGVGDLAAVPGGVTFDRNLVSLFQCGSPPALANELVGTAHLKTPVSDLAIFILHVNVKPAMRVGPLKLGHDTREFDAFVRVELGDKGVMRRQRHQREE